MARFESAARGAGGADPAAARRSPAVRRALAVLVPETVRLAAEVLGARGVPLLPLKGALAQVWLYEDPSERLATDADVLVEPARFEEAVTALREAGFRWRGEVPRQGQAVLLAPTGVALDLHAWPLGPSRFRRFGAEALFARARPAREPFGAPLWLPHPEDFVLHLVGKLVLDRVRPDRGAVRWEDLERAARRLAIDPSALAARAWALGMRRALRYAALGLQWRGAKEGGVRWAGRVAAALGPDPVGEAIGRLAAVSGRARGAPIPFLLLEPDARAALGALARRLVVDRA